MISTTDFNKKQILIVFFNEGEKLCFSNDNVIVKDKDKKIKFQCSCYRVFIIYAIGSFSVTSVLIQKSKKFGINIVLMSASFRIYTVIGSNKDGNTLLKKKQYQYNDNAIAKRIIVNKIYMQQLSMKKIRKKTSELKESIKQLDVYINQINTCKSIQELMGYEGIVAKTYFKYQFSDEDWIGRQPRIKRDYINSCLDIGYTMLFGFIEGILVSYGFDLYVGVLHKEFYMRKSLVCDLIEPFRTIVDDQVKKSINLQQFKEKDFISRNNQYQLDWKQSPYYIEIFSKAILEHKDLIFIYIQTYYRCFMKGSSVNDYPFYTGEKNDNN